MLRRLAALLLLASPLPAQCPTWAPGFGASGTSAPVLDLATFDAGSGPALYLAGGFAGAGDASASGIARWDATGWSAPDLGPSIAGGKLVHRLRVLDLGNGPRLVALGDFTAVGGQPARGVATWDGAQWGTLAGGPPVSAPFTQLRLFAAAVVDLGDGPTLYVGGRVAEDGYEAFHKPYLARWDGSAWTAITDGPREYEHCALECGPAGVVTSLEVFDGGGGPALYAGGNFRLLGPPETWNLARWDGVAWSAPGGAGVGGAAQSVGRMAVHDDGGGDALYVTGSFPGYLVRWDGVAFDAPVQGFLGQVENLRSLPAVAGRPAGLWAVRKWGSSAPIEMQRWDGSQWVLELSVPTDGHPHVLDAFDAGGGAHLFLAGDFESAGGETAANVVAYDGGAWSALWSGLGWNSTSEPGFVSALAVHDDGSGPALYCGGEFTSSGGVEFADLARWDGSAWQPVPGLVLPSLHHVEDLLSLDLGEGPRLWVAGDLKFPNLNPLGVGVWDGTTLAPIPGTMSQEGTALAAYDDGAGTRLYYAAGGTLRRWDGASFATFATISGGAGIRALAVHDDGSGPALYVAGGFTSFAGVPASRVARWDGVTWSALGSGIGGGGGTTVHALCSFDDGHGARLYAGGQFTTADGAPASNVAVWDGQGWQALGAGVGGVGASVSALAGFDHGGLSGRELYAGGQFTAAGGQPAANLARWDGQGWSAAGLETSGSLPGVRALLGADLPALGGRALSVGGTFDAAGGVTSKRYARLGACPEIGEIFCLGDGTQGDCPCANAGLPGHGCENSASIRGAELHASGSNEHDTVVLDVGFLPPTALAIFLQGDLVLGAPATFGDGLRCIGGSLKRLYVENAVAGLASAPGAGDPSIQERSGALGDPLQPGSVRGYQVYYRDPSPTFCPEPAGSTFNISNGMLIVW